MKTKIKVVKEVDIKYVDIDVTPRYIGDGDDDDIPTDFPLLSADKTRWVATVLIDTGEILQWPQGEERELQCKVCDQGTYTLRDDAGNIVKQLRNEYAHPTVPDSGTFR